MVNIFLFLVTMVGYFIFLETYDEITNPRGQTKKRYFCALLVIAFIATPFRIDKNIYTIAGNAVNEEGSIYSLLSFYQKAEGTAFSVISLGSQKSKRSSFSILSLISYQSSKENCATVFGLGIAQKAQSVFHFFGLNIYQKGKTCALVGGVSIYQKADSSCGVEFGVSAYQKGEEVFTGIGAAGYQVGDSIETVIAVVGYQDAPKIKIKGVSFVMYQKKGERKRSFVLR